VSTIVCKVLWRAAVGSFEVSQHVVAELKRCRIVKRANFARHPSGVHSQAALRWTPRAALWGPFRGAAARGQVNKAKILRLPRAA